MDTHLAVARVMEAGVSREDEETTGLVTPADLIAAHDCLHDGVEATFRGVQIAGHGRVLHLHLHAHAANISLRAQLIINRQMLCQRI